MRRAHPVRRLALALILGCGAAAATQAATVWAVHGAKNTVYLAGSVHVLKPADAQLPAALERAYAAARTLVMEIDVSHIDPMAEQDYLLEHGSLPPERTLRQVLGEARYQRIEREATRVGLPLESLGQFEPWAVALTLTQLEFAAAGLDPEAGVERQLEHRAETDHKQISGLETLEDQLDVLHGLSLEDQSRFLELTAAEGGDIQGETATILAAWRSGDARALERLLRSEYDEFPDLFRPLVTERNRRWLPEIAALLGQEHDVLVVVGALHLVGPDGVIELLRRRGLDPKPLD